MKRNRKLLPTWLLVIIDVAAIAAYTGGFYLFYYLTPRQLESSGAKTIQESTISSTTVSDKSEGSDSTSDQSTSETTKTAQTTAKDWSNKFADKFTNNVVTTDNSYRSKDISIQVKKYTKGSGNNLVTYYVADVYVANIKCLQSGFAKNTYGVGYTENVLSMDQEFNALLAINGDYYGNGSNGTVIRNGEVYRSTTNGSDVCVLYYDGTMKTFTADEFDVDQAIKDGAYQAWSFGPALLDEAGNSKSSFTADGHVSDSNPRSAIGYYEPGHYCFVVVDGRQNGYSAGLNLTDFSQLMKDLGCSAAYNLDGGKSSEMSFSDALVNQPCDGGREVSDCIMIKEVK